MLHLIRPLRLHCFLSTFVGRVAIRDVGAPSLCLPETSERDLSGFMPGGALRRQLGQRAGAASYYDAPQNTGTEMPFVHDLDSPGVLLDVVIRPPIVCTGIRPLIVCTGLARGTVGGPV